MRILFLVCLSLLISCNQPGKHKIELPVVSPDFYWNALKKVQVQYAKKPNDRLLRQKLFYYEKLNWPKESITDLNIFLEKHGLDESLVRQFLEYYLNNKQYKALAEMLDKWEFYNGLNEELSQFRVLSNYRAHGVEGTKQLIEDYVQKFKSAESYEFAVDQAVEIGDTTLIINLFEELLPIDSKNRRLQVNYVPILIEQKDYETAYEVLSKSSHSSSFQQSLLRSQVLYGLDSIHLAKRQLISYENDEAYIQLSRWYRQEFRYDSAIYFLDKVIEEDSSRNLLFAKAEILDEKGWINSSYALFDLLAKRDTTDSIAAKKSDILARKIAYLRNLKEQEKNIPVLELTPKKITE